MAMHLFPHNETAYQAAIHMLSERGRAAVVHPTGTGKSFIGFKLCEDNPDRVVCWLSPSRYIYQTQLENLAETSNGFQPDNIKFYTYAKLMLLTDEEISEIQPDYIILDEFHRCGADLWGAGVNKLLNTYQNVPVLGLSATAIRYLDNQRNMTEELFYGNIASEMTLGEAIVRNILAPPKYILSIFSYQQNFEKLEKRVQNARSQAVHDAATAYLDALRRALDKAEKLPDLFDKHMTERHGKYIVFCANLEHMQSMMEKASEWFALVDTDPHIYSLYSYDPTASKSFNDFKADNDENHLKLLYCIDALNEGVHVPDISGVILLRPTVSPIIYKQQIGRALSASTSNHPVIFDIVNNVENLYSIDALKEEMQSTVQYFHTHDRDSLIVNETFELIDRVADCREIFSQLEGTLSATWDVMYELAKKYYQENGNLNVIEKYYTEEGYGLGQWVSLQRRIYNGTAKGSLTQVQIEKLSEIGMEWGMYSDVSWEKYYTAAKKYYEAHGNLLPTVTYKDENGLRLGTWLTALRGSRRYGTREKFLTPERIEMLDKIGMVWDITSYSWDKYYSSAARYYEEHGDLKVPANYIDSDGVYLGKWITRLKAIRRGESPNSRDLTEEQIERLDKIGMVWERQRDKNWDKMFQELCTYYEEYHTFQFSEFDKSDKKNELPRWCARQRELYKVEKLSEERIAKLKSINFPFDGVANESLLRAEEMKTWELKFQAAKAYYVEHGDLNIPSDFKVNGYYLSVWINEQRLLIKGNRRKKLTEEQIEKLAAIGIYTNERCIEEKWNEKFEIAKKYFLQYGNLSVPPHFMYEGINLSVWILYQRSRYKNGKLSQKCYEKLSSIGMVWEIDTEYKYEENYNTGFQHLEEYIRENGVESITENTICSDGYKLGIWVGNCRSKYRNGVLKKRYIERFQALGIDLGEIKGEASYEKGFQHLEEFIREHGVGSLTNGIVCADGYNLGIWYANCRIKFRKGTMKPCYVERFESLGVRLEEVRDEMIEQQYETGFQHLEDFRQHRTVAKMRKK